MALFYTGSRFVLKGRSTADEVNPYTGKKAVYSNYSIFDTSHILDGAPTTNHVPGTGYSPHGLQMSRWFTGLDDAVQPLKKPGENKPVLTWWISPLTLDLLSGKDGQGIFLQSFGHTPRVTSYSEWSNFIYRGVNARHLINSDAVYGHVSRRIGDAGAASSFGDSDPWLYHGVSKQELSNPGLPLESKPIGNEYGNQETNIWKGVPSARALP